MYPEAYETYKLHLSIYYSYFLTVYFRNLKYLRINDLPNAGNKSLVSLLLQEDNPDLTVLGVDLEALDHMTENSQAPENIVQDSLSTKQSSSDQSQKQADSEKT